MRLDLNKAKATPTFFLRVFTWSLDMEELKSFTVSGMMAAPKPTASGTASVLPSPPPSAPDFPDVNALMGKILKIVRLIAEKFGLDIANTPDLIGKIGELLSWLFRTISPRISADSTQAQ
jgi:hypothetical protein